MGRRFARLTTTLAAAVLGLTLNSILLADNSSEDPKRSTAAQYDKIEYQAENDYAPEDKRAADYLLAKEKCNALSSDERGACRAEAKAKYVAMIEHGTSVHAYALYAEKLRLFPDFLLVRSGLR